MSKNKCKNHISVSENHLEAGANCRAGTSKDQATGREIFKAPILPNIYIFINLIKNVKTCIKVGTVNDLKVEHKTNFPDSTPLVLLLYVNFLFNKTSLECRFVWREYRCGGIGWRN